MGHVISRVAVAAFREASVTVAVHRLEADAQPFGYLITRITFRYVDGCTNLFSCEFRRVIRLPDKFLGSINTVQ